MGFVILRHMKPCDICPIISGPDQTEREARIMENDTWFATLRVSDQSLLGTTYITSRNHIERLSDLVFGEWQEFKAIYDPLERAVTEAFGASVVNLSFLMNHAFRSPDPSPHVHAHFKPRYSAPVEVNGVVFTDSEFGNYLPGGQQPKPVDPETAKVIVDMIKQNL